MSLYVPPVTNVQHLSQYNKLGNTTLDRVVSPSEYKPTSNVETEKQKEDPTNPNTTTKKVLDWAIYNIKAQHVQTPHIGVNIDKLA